MTVWVGRAAAGAAARSGRPGGRELKPGGAPGFALALLATCCELCAVPKGGGGSAIRPGGLACTKGRFSEWLTAFRKTYETNCRICTAEEQRLS